MNIDGLVEAVSAGIGASAVVAESMRRYWRRREMRNQKAFEDAVSRIVDRKLAALRTDLTREIRSNRSRHRV